VPGFAAAELIGAALAVAADRVLSPRRRKVPDGRRGLRDPSVSRP
jgi:hypothetical protein